MLFPKSICLCFLYVQNLPGFAEELVLDEEGKAEHHYTLHRHGKQILPHHFPA